MPLTVRKFNAQVKDPTTGDMIPAGLLSSDSLEAIEAAETAAVAAVGAKQAVSEAAIELKGATTLASIPADYTTLDNEVDDLKTQVNKYGEKIIINQYLAVADDELSITSGKYLNDNGQERTTSNTSFMVTGLIDVSNTLKVRCIGKGSGPYSIHFYDINQNQISRVQTTAEVSYDLYINVPIEAKYLRVSSFQTIPKAFRDKPINLLAENINNKIKNYDFTEDSVIYEDEYVGDTSKNILGGFIDTSGALITTAPISPYSYYSDFIPIKTVDMQFSGNCTASVIGVHYYDENQGYIGHEITTSASKVQLNVPEDASYMRLTSYDQKFTLWLPMTVKDKVDSLGNGNNLYNKNVTVIGDSITEYNFRAKENWSMRMERLTLCHIQNLGVSGTGFVRYNPYINRINSINEDADIIGVACSFNDLDTSIPLGTVTDTGTATICGYINDFFTALVSAFPTKPIICYCQNPWATAKLGIEISDNYVNAVKTICEAYNIPFYGDMYYKGSALRPWIQANCVEYFTSDNDDIGNVGVVDNVHPNSKGHIIIERHLVNYFNENVAN